MRTWIVTLLLLAGCAYGASRKGHFYRLDLRETSRVVFVLDVSGSMEGATGQEVEREVMGTMEDEVGGLIGGRMGSTVEGKLSERRKKIEEAKRNLISAVRGMDESTEVNLVYFSGGVTTWKEEPVPATDEHRSQLVAFIRDLGSSGDTNMIAGVREGLDEAPQVLIVVSDGEPTTSTPQEILDLVAENNPDGAIVVHTVGIGEDHDRAFMRSLAEDNGGTYKAR